MIAAVIGYGAVGRRHAHNFNRLGYDVRTWDLNPAGCTVPTVHEALESATLAVIATPPDSHVKYTVMARAMGVPWILSEKPLALSMEEAEPLRDAPGIFVGYCLRFALATQSLPAAIARIAPLRLVEAVYSERVDARPGSWLLDCGAALEYSHALDILCWLLDFPVCVEAHSEAMATVALLGWSSGVVGTVRMDFYSPTDTHITFIGDGGVVTWHRNRITGPGCDEGIVDQSAAWLLHEAQELHSIIKGAIPSPGRLCTVNQAIDVLHFAEQVQ